MNLGGRPNPPSIVDEGGSDDESQDEEAHTFDISGKSSKIRLPIDPTNNRSDIRNKASKHKTPTTREVTRTRKPWNDEIQVEIANSKGAVSGIGKLNVRRIKQMISHIYNL